MQSLIRTVLLTALTVAALFACTEAPSWQKLLASKIKQHYPAYTVEAMPDGALRVLRPDKSEALVNVEEIAQLCQRGSNDCNYATDQMLLGLQN